jgi:hypothetical protein
MPKFTVEMDTERYRLCCDGEEGADVPYGFPAALAIGTAMYYVTINEPDDDAEIEALKACRVDSVTAFPVDTEDVEFEEDEEEEDEVTKVEVPDQEEEEEGEEVPE